MNAIDKKITDKRKERQDIINKKKTVREGGVAQTGNITVFEQLKQYNQELNKIRDVKNDLGKKLKNYHGEIDGIQAEKANLLKQMHAQYHTEDQVKQGIKELEYQMTTRTLNATQEQKMIKEISNLKKSIPSAKRFSELDPLIKQLKADKGKVWGELQKVRD